MITVNLDKAKAISHEIRRKHRASEFAPYDELISKQIPGSDLSGAESSRTAIREKYAAIQTSIDKAKTPEKLLSILQSLAGV